MSKSNLRYVSSLLVYLVAGAVIATVILLAVSCSPTEAPNAAAKVDDVSSSPTEAPHVDDARRVVPHKVEGQELEKGIWPFIMRRISVARSITEQQLREVLLHELEEIRQLDYGPRQEQHCAFTVHAYCEPVNARNFSGPILASISLLRNQEEPRLSIRKEAVVDIKEPPQVKFGLEDDIRRLVYWDLTLANLESSDQADREFPDSPLSYSEAEFNQYSSKRSDRFDELWEQKQEEIATEYNINREQASAIDSEGERKHWPYPPDPLRK